MKLICPNCGSTKIDVLYTAPLRYECRDCGAKLRDANAPPAIQVLDEKYARLKRPGMYGLPVCPCCSHAPHPGPCVVCEAEKAEREREVRLVEGW